MNRRRNFSCRFPSRGLLRTRCMTTQSRDRRHRSRLEARCFIKRSPRGPRPCVFKSDTSRFRSRIAIYRMSWRCIRKGTFLLSNCSISYSGAEYGWRMDTAPDMCKRLHYMAYVRGQAHIPGKVVVRAAGIAFQYPS